MLAVAGISLQHRGFIGLLYLTSTKEEEDGRHTVSAPETKRCMQFREPSLLLCA